MGHSQADKAETHRRIVEIAARRFREKGIDGIGVADLMKEAGLTVGGFYKHFASKEALVAEAVAAAGGQWGGDDTIDDIIDRYLSSFHRDNEGAGCVYGAIGPEIARSGEGPRDIARARLDINIDYLAGLVGGEGEKTRRDKALLTYSALIGAIVIARVAKGGALSEEVMESVARQLKAM